MTVTCIEDPDIEIRQSDPEAKTLTPEPPEPDVNEFMDLLSSGKFTPPPVPGEFEAAPEPLLTNLWETLLAFKVALRYEEKKAQRRQALLERSRSALLTARVYIGSASPAALTCDYDENAQTIFALNEELDGEGSGA